MNLSGRRRHRRYKTSFPLGATLTFSSPPQHAPVETAMAVMIRNEVFSCFVFYGVLLVIKMYIIAIITGQVRLRKKAFANPEDALRHGGLQFNREDPYVERCRRAHRNDLENILPFLFLGAIYSLTGPSLAVARLHFLVFFLSRMLHTLAYLFALRAPTRSLAYTVAQIPCVSMAVQILMAVAAYA
ncbi:prostaglandin E synthase [Trachinotus anak]|uniref:prostaglandin E synthase n=1 Tax=Trachinotus anak TaxID=443729 RepID=UPI0039F21C93